MEIITIIIGVIFAPVAIKMLDKTYKSFKRTELYRDISVED